MAAPKAPPQPKPALENFHTVGQAAVRLNLKTQAEHDEGSKSGERWLRDGVNRPENGSEGPRFPCHRMSGQLMFSDSDLAEIAAINRNAPDKRAGRKRRTRKNPPTAKRTALVTKPVESAEPALARIA